ncbi:hypothetical protein [Pajaroellobacter abortibovis]|uniref:hypothetical protein n=1 Tax=Pajaroellobacter abortibovis TaxID=1882918 RepID=UPI0012EC3891|nr:hypothetical protein [Pajaroellobacter abortibovis]
MGYLWGSHISPEALATGTIAARCHYAMHLNMNPGLAGFEFYHGGLASGTL